MRPCAIARPAAGRTPGAFFRAMALALIAWQPAMVAALELQDVRVGRTDERTRIVLESDQAIRFSLFAVRYPDRFLLDLEGLADEPDLAKLARSLGAAHPYIRSLRVLRGDGMTTLELILAERLEPQIFTLPPQSDFGHRLVLDIFAPGHVPPAVLHQPAPPADRPDALARAPAAPAEPTAPPPRPAAPPPAPAAAIPAPASAAAPPPAPVASATPPATLQAAPDARALPQETWVAVQINGQDRGETVLALQRGGSWLLRREDLQRWRLRLPQTQPVVHAGEPFHPLDAFRGLSYRLDEATQTLLLEAGPGVFEGTVLGGLATPGFSAPPPAPPGAALNYELLASGTSGDERLDGTLEAFGFGPWGRAGSTFVARDLTGASEWIRLETTWTRDLPARMASLRVGDTISGAGLLGRPVRLGGVQWATNFATQPGFITFPLPGMAGEAVLPSVVELYVNGALRSRDEVPTGPFSIEHLPVITGQGQALLVVRDLLGRERVITQPFHVSSTLLQPGLGEYSYEIGAIRENFGLVSNDYGRLAAIATHRHGIRDWLTAEAHMELLEDQQLLGVGATLLWRDIGVLQASIARSQGIRGDGGRVGAGFERQGRVFSVGLNAEYATSDFVQLGLDPGKRAPRLIARVFANLSLARAGSLGLSYALQDQRDGTDLEQAGLHYSVGLGAFGFLNVSLLRLLGEEPDTLVGVNLAFPFGEARHASVGYQHEDGHGTTQLQLQRNAPAGPGYGYRLLAGLDDPQRADAGLILQNDVGRYQFGYSRVGDQTGWRASASGGLALLGGGLFFSRPITDSFAVVQLPGYEDVRVYADNQEVARTDAQGNALVPTLRAYERNPLRIEQADLPLDAQIESLDVAAVPYARSGVLVTFPITRSRGVLLTLLREDGTPVPAGAVGRVEGMDGEFPVGYQGQIYLTGLGEHSALQLHWPGGSCTLEVEFADTGEPVTDLGPHTCTRATP